MIVNINNHIELSPYAAGLQSSVKKRYIEKIAFINYIDPYNPNVKLSPKKATSGDNFPKIYNIDIYNYLVLRTSYYTHEQLKAYKSLESYNVFISGWVHSVKYCEINGNILIIGKVSELDFKE